MEEIIALSNGDKFKIWYESPEERIYAMKEAEDRYINGSLKERKILSLAALSCPSTSKIIGQTLNLSSSPTGGTPPYSYTFWKTLDGITRKTLQTGSISSYTYTLITEDLANPTFGVTVKDSCPTGGLVGEEWCTIIVNAPCTNPVANLTIT